MINFQNDLSHAFDSEVLSVYKPRFSASNFPYCVREHFIYTYLPEDKRPLEGNGFYKDFFTNQGKIIHTVIQNALGRANLILGDWVCANDRCNNRDVIKMQVGAPKCSSCNNFMSYQELSLNRDLFNGMGGFIDGLLPSYNAILEIKTKSKYALEKLKEPIYNEWALQASSYSDAVEIQYGCRADNIIMLYMNRDNPHLYKVFERKAVRGVLQDQLNKKKEGDKIIANKVLPDGICSDIREGMEENCPYAKICFSPSLKNILNVTI